MTVSRSGGFAVLLEDCAHSLHEFLPEFGQRFPLSFGLIRYILEEAQRAR